MIRYEFNTIWYTFNYHPKLFYFYFITLSEIFLCYFYFITEILRKNFCGQFDALPGIRDQK